MIKIPKVYLLLLLSVLVSACAPSGRYYQTHDSAPKVVPSQVTTTDVTPKYEPYAPANLRPYTIRGINYQPMTTGYGHSDSGKASWYGQKFHGHQTANGEIYDMYQMSAAHKTLPLPSFARITNLDNGKQVVLRINDRGPFHSRRIIDLSYAAALKLDMLKTGVANVKLDVIHVSPAGNLTIGKPQPLIEQTPEKQQYIQVLALKNKERITQLGKKLSASYGVPYRSISSNGLFKLQLGPIPQKTNINTLLNKIKNASYKNAYPVSVG